MLLRRYHNRKPTTRGYGVPIDSPKFTSIAEMSVKELKELCKERGLKGYSRMNEADLIELLLGGVDDVGTE
ncbi:Rho termination factor N-terminal domain-containing protein [Solibacillus sp. FSL R7-0668]|uniref:Rho termination factor N-terminal domain-containing protein n=1 Tax=Solibacillus sp. FSL R7-0668 TaxID=2921688 RepID=UPI0030FA4B64